MIYVNLHGPAYQFNISGRQLTLHEMSASMINSRGQFISTCGKVPR